MAGPIPLPPLNINSASSAGANTGGFSIGGLNVGQNAQSGALIAQLPLLGALAVAGLGLVLIFKKS